MKTSRNPNSKASKSAFTLVELLVTITIIAVLASLGFITLRKLKESASAAVDAGEMRQISGAVVMFASDNNDLLPTTSGGISPRYRKTAKDLKMELYPYFGYTDPQEGDFMPEFASADWQSATRASDGYGPSLVIVEAFSGVGKPAKPFKPSPSFNPFGYPYSPNKTTSMSLSGAMSKMTDPAVCLMLIEIDQMIPGLGKPGWISSVPEKMAHGSYRLGLYWDGHVGRLDVNLNPL